MHGKKFLHEKTFIRRLTQACAPYTGSDLAETHRRRAASFCMADELLKAAEERSVPKHKARKQLADAAEDIVKSFKIEFEDILKVVGSDCVPSDRKELRWEYHERMAAFSKASAALRGYDSSKHLFERFRPTAWHELNVSFNSALAKLAAAFSDDALGNTLPAECSAARESGEDRLAIAMLDLDENPKLKIYGIVAGVLGPLGILSAAMPFAIPPIAGRLGIVDRINPAWIDWMNQDWICSYGNAPHVLIEAGLAALTVSAIALIARRAAHSPIKQRERLLKGIISWRESQLAAENAETVFTRVDEDTAPKK
jgi:hypothetical protein